MYVKPPAECSTEELKAFEQLVLSGGQVNPTGLSDRLKTCKLLAFCYDGAILIAVAAIKNKEENSVKLIHSKAGVECKSTPTLELGYCVTAPAYRGRGWSKKLKDLLLESIPNQSVFAVTGNEVIRRYLLSREFSAKGQSFQGKYNEQLTYYERGSISYFSVNDFFWIQVANNCVVFGSPYLSKEIHATISLHPEDDDINFHLTKNTSDNRNKPKVEVVRISKQLLSGFTERDALALLFGLFEPVQIDLTDAEYVPLDDLENHSKDSFKKLFTERDYKKRKSKFKLKVDVLEKVSQMTQLPELTEAFSKYRKPVSDSAANVEGGILLTSSDSIPAIKFFDTWYTLRLINDFTEVFRGLLDDDERRKLKWRFKAALVSVRQGNTFDDTKQENAKVLRLLKKV